MNPTLNDPSSVGVSFSNIILIPADRELELQGWWMPLFAMGVSMGGGTVIHAAASEPPLDGLMLMDPLLDTQDVIKSAGWVKSGLPRVFIAPSAWAATALHGLPGGDNQPPLPA